MNLNQVWRYLLCFLLGVIVIGCGLIVYITILLPAILWKPWPLHILVVGNIFIPLMCLLIYFMPKILPPPYEKIRVKGFRQWAIIYVFVLGIVLYWALLAFLFDTFTPFLSVGLRGLGLPFFVYLITILLLTRTQIGRRLKQLLKLPERLFKEDE